MVGVHVEAPCELFFTPTHAHLWRALWVGSYIERITNDAREDEMNENLGVVHDILGDLKNQAAAMGAEIDEQNGMIDQIQDKTQSNIKRVDVSNAPVIYCNPDSLSRARRYCAHALIDALPRYMSCHVMVFDPCRWCSLPCRRRTVARKG
jgi:hypothetical protein